MADGQPRSLTRTVDLTSEFFNNPNFGRAVPEGSPEVSSNRRYGCRPRPPVSATSRHRYPDREAGCASAAATHEVFAVGADSAVSQGAAKAALAFLDATSVAIGGGTGAAPCVEGGAASGFACRAATSGAQPR